MMKCNGEKDNHCVKQGLKQAIKIIQGIYECPFIYNGIEMDRSCCANCCESEPSENQETECWTKFFNSSFEDNK